MPRRPPSRQDGLELGVEAIQSVSMAMKRVNDELTAKNIEIDVLQTKNNAISTEIKETLAGVQQVREEIADRDRVLQQCTERNEELFRALTNESSAFNSLTETFEVENKELGDTEDKNLGLLSDQVEQKKVRNQLAAEMKDSQRIIRSLEKEKEKYKEIFKELETKLRAEMEMCAAQKKRWNEEALAMMRELTQKEQSSRVGKRRANDLGKSVVKLTDHNEMLDTRMKRNEEELQTIVKDYGDTELSIQKYEDHNAGLSDKLWKTTEGHRKSTLELEKSADQLQLMSDKVLQLMEQLQAMEAWKSESEAQHRKLCNELHELNARAENLGKQVDVTNKRKERLDTSGKLLVNRIVSERKQTTQMRRRVTEVAGNNLDLETRLRKTDEQVLKVTMQHADHSAALSTIQNQRANEKRLLSTLDHRVADFEQSIHTLTTQLHGLEGTKQKQLKQLSGKEGRIKAYKDKDAYFQKVQADWNDHKEEQLTALDNKSGETQDQIDEDEEKHATPFRQCQLQLRKTLKSKEGEHLVTTLKKMKLAERDIVDWVHDPAKMLDKLFDMFNKATALEASGQKHARQAAQREEKLELMGLKNQVSMQNLQIMEDQKTKFVMRFINLLALEVSTEQQQQLEDSMAEMDMEDQRSLSTIQLSDNGIDDNEAIQLVRSLRDNAIVTELDLRGNTITTYGMLTVVNECLASNSKVDLLDLQQNHVTLDGLLSLAFLVLCHAGRDEVLPKTKKDVGGKGGKARPESRQRPDSRSSQNGSERPRGEVGEVDQAAWLSAFGPCPGTNTARVVSARLRRENNALLPIMDIKTPTKILTIDLRFNRLQKTHRFSTRPNPAAMKQSLNVLTQLLLLASKKKLQLDPKLLSSGAYNTFFSWCMSKKPPDLPDMDERPGTGSADEEDEPLEDEDDYEEDYNDIAKTYEELKNRNGETKSKEVAKRKPARALAALRNGLHQQPSSTGSFNKGFGGGCLAGGGPMRLRETGGRAGGSQASNAKTFSATLDGPDRRKQLDRLGTNPLLAHQRAGSKGKRRGMKNSTSMPTLGRRGKTQRGSSAPSREGSSASRLPYVD